MKIRPILFSAEMIRALLDGKKTQSRRVCKLQPQPYFSNGGFRPLATGDWHWFVGDWRMATTLGWCPYGQPGDLLWVRESGWQPKDPSEKELREGADTWPKYVYDANGPLTQGTLDDFKAWGWKRRPSIHMPRWASRLTLKLTDVRVQRLQDISEEDVKSEGIAWTDFGEYTPKGKASVDGGKTFHPFKPRLHNGWHFGHVESPDQCYSRARTAFAALWDSINAKRGFGWETNPWVWALTFTVHRGNVDKLLTGGI